MKTTTARSLLTLALLAGCTPQPQAPAPAPVAAAPAPGPLPDLVVRSEPVLAGSAVLGREAIPHHDPRYRDYYEEARILLEEDRTGEAIDALRMALFDTPDSAAAWSLLGASYLDVGRKARGVECLQEALIHDRDRMDAHRLLARHFLDQGEHVVALPHARRLRQRLPEDGEAALLMARVYLGRAMWTEAIDEARRSIARDPGAQEAYNALGFAALQVGRNELARQYLEAASELSTPQAHVLNNLGIAYERLGRPVDALAAFAQASDIDPGSATAVANRRRVRELVDQQTADSIAQMLAERARGPEPELSHDPFVDEAPPPIVPWLADEAAGPDDDEGGQATPSPVEPPAAEPFADPSSDPFEWTPSDEG